MTRSNVALFVMLASALVTVSPAAALAQDPTLASDTTGTTGADPTLGADAAVGTSSGTDPTASAADATATGTEAGAGATAVDPTATPAEPSLSHRYQVGLRVGIGVPFTFGLKYKDGPPCDDAMQTWCRHFGVGMLDLDLGFGVTDSIEVSFSARFGLADEEASHSAPLSLGLGLRAYGSPESMVKAYFGPRLILDLTGADSAVRPGWKSVDFGVRADVGIQVDFMRYVGAYGQLGLTLSFLRALMFVPDLSIGLQVRLP